VPTLEGRVKPDPTIESLLERLRELLPALKERYAVESLEVFGSRVRSDAHGDSDLDLLVTFTVAPGLFALIRMEEELSANLGVKVDLVMRQCLKPHLRSRIMAEAIPV